MDEIIQTLALSLGLSWASGLNLYATVAMLGILGNTGNITLPEQLVELQEPRIITAALIMYCVEFFADKIPIVDSIWDAIHSFIRVPVGAALMSHAIGDGNPVVHGLAYLVGGGVSGAVHVGKAGTRILANTSPEPYSNWFLSFSEDIAVIVGLWTALHHPLVFLIFITFFMIFLFWFIPKIWNIVLGDFVGVRLKLTKRHAKIRAEAAKRKATGPIPAEAAASQDVVPKSQE